MDEAGAWEDEEEVIFCWKLLRQMSQNLFTCCLIMLIVMAGCSLSQAVITTQPQFHSNHKRQSSKSREISFFMIISCTWRSRCFPVSPKATLLPSFCSSVVKFPKKMTSAANLFLLVALKTFGFHIFWVFVFQDSFLEAQTWWESCWWRAPAGSATSCRPRRRSGAAWTSSARPVHWVQRIKSVLILIK